MEYEVEGCDILVMSFPVVCVVSSTLLNNF